jgi:SAM-dependent methyltransferase
LFPLDYAEGGYPYLERPNRALLALFDTHRPVPVDRALRVLDVGCGAGTHGREIRRRVPDAHLVGVEPDPSAAALARDAFDVVREARIEDVLASNRFDPFDVVVLSDVIEHQVEPVRFLRLLRAAPATENALYLVSVPNYAVWYNRARTLAGRFEYTWSGLYDRTHLRFFTRASLEKLLAHVELDPVGWRASPSLVQSLAPWLRSRFEASLRRGEHRALSDSPAFRAYERWIEPVETAVCAAWPTLLAFQLVVAAVPRRATAKS